MKNKLLLVLFLFLSVGLHDAAAQLLPMPTNAPVLKDATNGGKSALFTVGEVKGSIKSPAVYLAKPQYPIEARQAGAEGAVKVRVEIDEEGNVVAANAFEGNPLLYAVCENAARLTKFRSAHNADGAVTKIEGVLTYEFIILKAGWTRIGYGLSLLDKLPVSSFSIPTAAKAFAPEWTNEREMLEKLDEIRRNEPPPSSPLANNTPVLRNTTRLSNGSVQESATIQGRLILPAAPSAEQIKLAEGLIAALQNRLKNDETSLWQFNLGLHLSEILQRYRNPYQRAAAAQAIRQTAQNAPAGINGEVTAALENLAVIFEKSQRTINSDDEIGRLLAIIFRNEQ